jgi:hypothetical protein
MAKLPPIDTQAHWIREMLHKGQREEARVRIIELLATGRAGAETQKLAAEVFAAKRGRQPYGAKHLWFEIGQDNEELRDAGKSYEERMMELGGRYLLAKNALEIAIAKYESAMIEIRAENDRIHHEHDHNHDT